MSLQDQMSRVNYAPVVGSYLSNQDRSLLREPSITSHLAELKIVDPYLAELYLLCVMLRMQEPNLHPMRIRLVRDHPSYMLLLLRVGDGESLKRVTSLTAEREAKLHAMFDQTARVIGGTMGDSFEPTNYSAQYLAVEREE